MKPTTTTPPTASTPIEPTAHAASSLHYAIGRAPAPIQHQLQALYAIHAKWREAANSHDNHFAVTTLNWWHDTLEQAQTSTSDHPALHALQQGTTTPKRMQDLQNLLHGHMHWHHLNRIETIEQLEPTITAIAGSYSQTYLHICGAPIEQTNIQNLIKHSAHALWWIDQTRHLGHNLHGQRIWLPMHWLKEAYLPAHLLINTQQPASTRTKQLSPLLTQIFAHTQQHIDQYHATHKQCLNTLPPAERTTLKSWHTLMRLRIHLFNTIQEDPQDVFEGLVSVAPLRKWWLTLSGR